MKKTTKHSANVSKIISSGFDRMLNPVQSVTSFFNAKTGVFEIELR